MHAVTFLALRPVLMALRRLVVLVTLRVARLLALQLDARLLGALGVGRGCLRRCRRKASARCCGRA
jgi:hypothetical protein